MRVFLLQFTVSLSPWIVDLRSTVVSIFKSATAPLFEKYWFTGCCVILHFVYIKKGLDLVLGFLEYTHKNSLLMLVMKNVMGTALLVVHTQPLELKQ